MFWKTILPVTLVQVSFQIFRALVSLAGVLVSSRTSPPHTALFGGALRDNTKMAVGET